MKQIPFEKLWWYLLSISTLPLLLTGFFFVKRWESVETIERQLLQVREAALAKNQKQALNAAVRRCFQEADHFYIDKYLETLTFLEPEMDSLQKILAQKNVVIDEPLKKRFSFLSITNKRQRGYPNKRITSLRYLDLPNGEV